MLLSVLRWIREQLNRWITSVEAREALAARIASAKEEVEKELELCGIFRAYERIQCGIIGEIEATVPHSLLAGNNMLEVVCMQYDGHMLIEHLADIDGKLCDFRLKRFSSNRDIEEIAAGRKPTITVSIITAVRLHDPALDPARIPVLA